MPNDSLLLYRKVNKCNSNNIEKILVVHTYTWKAMILVKTSYLVNLKHKITLKYLLI